MTDETERGELKSDEEKRAAEVFGETTEQAKPIDVLDPKLWLGVPVGKRFALNDQGRPTVGLIDLSTVLQMGGCDSWHPRNEPIHGCRVITVNNGKVARLDIESGLRDENGSYDVQYHVAPISQGLVDGLIAEGYTQNPELGVILSNGETITDETTKAYWDELCKVAAESWPKKTEEPQPEAVGPESPIENIG